MLHFFVLPTQAIPLPQFRFDVETVDLSFETFNFSPAFTISLSSFLHKEQYLNTQSVYQTIVLGNRFYKNLQSTKLLYNKK